MSFFKTVNDRFFNPFCCKNREIYFDCICQLIEKSKEIPVLYETDARNTLILYLRNCRYSIEAENIGEEISGGRTPQENAGIILRYFRACGWITPQEIGRSGDNIASVSVYCRKLLDAIRKIFQEDTNGAITNHIFSMYEILKSAFTKDSARAMRPYLNILVPLIENECDLKNELLVLKDSIREIMRAVIRIAEANNFGRFLIKDELLNRFFNDYFFIKKSGLIPSYISSIDQMLQKLRRSQLYEKMVQEYRLMENVEEGQALDKINRQFGELDSFINLEYDQEMSYIDRQINTYYNLYATRMMMVMGGNGNLEHQLNGLLIFLKNQKEKERQEALERLAQSHRLMSIGYIGKKSLERRRKASPNRKNIGLPAGELSQEEKRQLTDELLKQTPDRYSLDNTKKHFDGIFAGKDQVSLEECGIHTREDAMMIAAGIVYSDSVGFPYEVEFREGMVETEVARVSNVKIKRKKE